MPTKQSILQNQKNKERKREKKESATEADFCNGEMTLEDFVLHSMK